MIRTPNRRVLVFALAVSLALPLIPMADDTARGQTDRCDTLRNQPLFIQSVNITEALPSQDDDSFVPGNGAAYVEPGTELSFDVEVVNRFPGTGPQGQCTGSAEVDDLTLAIQYLDIDPSATSTHDQKFASGHTDLQGCDDPGETCSKTIRLPADVDHEVQPALNGSGEQRIRFLVYDNNAYSGTPEPSNVDNCAQDDSTGTGTGEGPGACTGAERIIVTGALPDLVVEDVRIPGQPQTTYDQPEQMEAEIDIKNEGEYPNWNPNGARDEGEFWERSSFDADGDGEPEESGSGQYSYDDTDVPSCQSGAEDPWPDGFNQDNPCSYRRGEIIQPTLRYELQRSDDSSLLEADTVPFYPPSDIDGPLSDKDAALLSGDTATKTRNIVDLTKLAGQYDLTVQVDRDEAEAPEGEYFNVTESDESNNDFERTVDILGVDLQISDANVVVRTEDGGSQMCTDPDNPCPTDGSAIRYDPAFENVGDPEVDDEGLRDRNWRASVYLNGEMEDWRNQSDVPKASNNDERSVFDLPREIQPEEGGGPHKVEVRLDHKENYEEEWGSFVTDDRGRVGERTERNDCPTGDHGTDNTYCITFYFEDQDPPEIDQSRLKYQSPNDDSEQVFTDSDSGVPRVPEGTDVTFEADVQDSGLTDVTATFVRADGSPANFTADDGGNFSELEMQPVDDEETTWRANATLRGDIDTEYEFKVEASDINNTAVHSFGTFELSQIPVEITVNQRSGGFTVNGERNFGSDPPEYRGTADDPENSFNISASINGTGLGDDEVAQQTSVEIRHPNGTTAAWTDVETVTRCMVTQSLGGDGPQPAEGENCGNTSTQDENSRWTAYYVNSTEDDVNVDLGWTGSFDIIYHVTDEFDRNASSPFEGKIADRPNDDGEVEPVLENATIAPTAVDPGGTVEASIEASDVLRVEEVTLNITKPSGDEVQAPLQVDELDDQTTLNGTYTGTFEVDASAEHFDQGGSYDVHLAAQDFAGHYSEAGETSLVVNDTQHPEIVEFGTVPAESQEVGGPVTWVAQIDDDTAVKPPILRIDRPNSGPTGAIEMAYNETRDRWEHGPVEASEVDVGTWTYDLTVEDYTDKQSTATGEIQIEENLAPQDQNWTPAVDGADGSHYGPAQPTISVDIVDYGQGVNRSSIAFTVNGEDRTEQAEITPISDCEQCYELRYTPDQAFDADSTVDLTVEAADVSEPPRESDTMRHQFQVDADPPRVDVQTSPAITEPDRRIVGIPTDITVSTTDGGSGPGKATVTVQDAEGASESITLAGGEGTFRLQELDEVVDGHGEYVVSVEATDAVGNTADPVQRPVLFDKLGPSVEVFAEPGKPREVVFANVTDDADIQKVVAKYSVDDGPEQELALEKEDGTWTKRLFNQRTGDAFQKGATVRFTVEATDIFGNVRSSPEKNFTAGDSVPEISFAEPAEGDELSGTTELAWTAEDAETPRDELRVSLFYKIEGGTFQEIPEAQDIPNQGSYSLDTTTLPNGDVTLQVFVLDGQNFAADEVNVTVRNLGQTFSSPEIEDARTEGDRVLVAPSQESVFRVQIDGNVRQASADIKLDGQVVKTIELENTGGSTWEASFQAPAERGNYTVDLVAETDQGQREAGSAYAFSVQGEPEGDNFIPEWTLLTALTATAVALGVLGLRRRWT